MTIHRLGWSNRPWVRCPHWTWHLELRQTVSNNETTPGFKIKDSAGSEVDILFKTRCVLRGEKKVAFRYFEPEKFFAPVVRHEKIRMFFVKGRSRTISGRRRRLQRIPVWWHLQANNYETTNKFFTQATTPQICLSAPKINLWCKTGWWNLGLTHSQRTNLLGFQEINPRSTILIPKRRW